MKVYYSTEIQMGGTYEVENKIMESAASIIGFSKADIEEQETHCVSVIHCNEIKPSDMKDRVRKFLVANPAVHYVDVMYRFEYAMVPYRFVIWSDGRERDYTGFVSFREDN